MHRNQWHQTWQSEYDLDLSDSVNSDTYIDASQKFGVKRALRFFDSK